MGLYAKLNPAFQALLDAATDALVEVDAAEEQIASAGTTQVAAVNTAGSTQVAAVNAAGTSAVATVAGSVSAAAASATSAAQSATAAGNYAAQANFSGYTGTFATRAAFGSPSGKAAGVYLVLADETYNGQPRAILVVSNAISAQWGVVLQTATQGVDLVGPLGQNAAGAANAVVGRIRPTAADTAAGYPDFVTRINRGTNSDGSPNWYTSIGWNANAEVAEGQTGPNAPFNRLVFEQDFRPGGGAHWAELYPEMKGYGNVPIRRPQFIVFDKNTNRTLSHRMSGDTLAFADGADNVVLQRFNNVWEHAPGDRVLLQGEGALLVGGAPGGEIPLVSRFGSGGSGIVKIGNENFAPTLLAPRIRMGDVETAGGLVDFRYNEGGGSVYNGMTFTTAGGNTDGGIGIVLQDGTGPSNYRSRMVMRHGGLFQFQKWNGTSWVGSFSLDSGAIAVEAPGGVIYLRSENGTTWAVKVSNDGDVSASLP